jgi:hypothetical protein
MAKERKEFDDRIYRGCLTIIDLYGQNFSEARDRWIDAKNFSGLGSVFIQSDAKECLMAGSIALRGLGEIDVALRHWDTALRSFEALNIGVQARKELQAADADSENADFHVGDFIYLQYCLLFAGDRNRLKKIREFYDLPVVRMNDFGREQPNILSAEARIQFAAWEGDISLVDSLAESMELHYREFKLPMIYGSLWKAVVRRDGDLLNSLLPDAEAAYTKSAKRKRNDIWGGDKSYNEAMFDIYTTSVLKIARDVGIAWSYNNANTRDIWPSAVIEQWKITEK